MIDQCINKKYKYDVNIDDNNSTYILFTLVRTNETNGSSSVLMYKKNSTEYEKVFFIRGFCLPQSNNDTCSQLDYKSFITAINNDLDDLLGKNITNIYTFMIRRDEENYGNGELFFYLLKFIPFFLFASYKFF